MKAEHLNSFIQGAQNILGTICGENARLGKVYLKPAPYNSGDIAVVIGINGELNGKIIYTMNHDMGYYLASKMMMGMDDETIKMMFQSAISEIMNMISGKVATLFYDGGVKIDITTPDFVAVPNPEFFAFVPPDAKLVCVPLVFDNGNVFEIDVWML